MKIIKGFRDDVELLGKEYVIALIAYVTLFILCSAVSIAFWVWFIRLVAR
jgi:hypothetical protein